MNTPWIPTKSDAEERTNRVLLRSFCPGCHRILYPVFISDALSDRQIRRSLDYICKACKTKLSQNVMMSPKDGNSAGDSTSQQSHNADTPIYTRSSNMSFPHKGSVRQRAGSLAIAVSPTPQQLEGSENFSKGFAGGAK